ncbi:MAG: peptidoglycan-binding domain-containing protein, partial [Brasilonema sp.]
GYSVKLSDTPLTAADTKTAIQEFQKGYQIKPANGTAGTKTQDFAAKIVEVLQTNLNLVTKPNPPLPRNQYYGPQTEAAVKQYQKKLGLQETGIADLALRQKLSQEAKEIKKEPTSTPTTKPSPKPTTSPTTQPKPTAKPTTTPTSTPRTSPTAKPTATPTSTPEALPTVTPTSTPEALPTVTPTSTPGVSPTATPTPTPRK